MKFLPCLVATLGLGAFLVAADSTQTEMVKITSSSDQGFIELPRAIAEMSSTIKSIVSALDPEEYLNNGVQLPLDGKTLEAIKTAMHARAELKADANFSEIKEKLQPKFAEGMSQKDSLKLAKAFEYLDLHELVQPAYSLWLDAVTASVSSDEHPFVMEYLLLRGIGRSKAKIRHESVKTWDWGDHQGFVPFIEADKIAYASSGGKFRCFLDTSNNTVATFNSPMRVDIEHGLAVIGHNVYIANNLNYINVIQINGSSYSCQKIEDSTLMQGGVASVRAIGHKLFATIDKEKYLLVVDAKTKATRVIEFDGFVSKDLMRVQEFIFVKTYNKEDGGSVRLFAIDTKNEILEPREIGLCDLSTRYDLWFEAAAGPYLVFAITTQIPFSRKYFAVDTRKSELKADGFMLPPRETIIVEFVQLSSETLLANFRRGYYSPTRSKFFKIDLKHRTTSPLNLELPDIGAKILGIRDNKLYFFSHQWNSHLGHFHVVDIESKKIIRECSLDRYEDCVSLVGTKFIAPGDSKFKIYDLQYIL